MHTSEYFIKSIAVAQRQRYYLVRNGPRFDLDKVEIFNFSLGLELAGMVGQNLNCLFLLQIYLGLVPNPS